MPTSIRNSQEAHLSALRSLRATEPHQANTMPKMSLKEKASPSSPDSVSATLDTMPSELIMLSAPINPYASRQALRIAVVVHAIAFVRALVLIT